MSSSRHAVRKDGPPLEAPANRDPFSYLENYLTTIGDQVTVARSIAAELVRDSILAPAGARSVDEAAVWLANASRHLNESRFRWREQPHEDEPLDPHVAPPALPSALGANDTGHSSPAAVRVARAVGGARILPPDARRDVRVSITLRGAHGVRSGEVELYRSRTTGSWYCSCARYHATRACEHTEEARRVAGGPAAA